MVGGAPAARGRVNVAELNPYAPRPYTFTEAALCLRDSIRAAGYASDIHVNETDALRRCIVLGALPPYLSRLGQLDPQRTVIYNLEQLAAGTQVGGAEYIGWLHRWMVADYHANNLQWLARVSGGRQRGLELPLVPGACVAFRPDLPLAPSVDVLFYGTPSPRRDAVLERLRTAGLSVEVLAGAYGEELAPAIKRARLVLHVHYHDTALFPSTRILQPVAQGVPIVCEAAVCSPLADWSASGIVFAPYEQLVPACVALLRSEQEGVERARANQTFAAAIDFATPLEAVLRALQAQSLPLATPQTVPAPTPPPQPPPPDRAPEGLLSTEEIEAILARESPQLPPEQGSAAPPIQLAERDPARAPYARWLVLLVMAMAVGSTLLGIWRSLR